MSRLTPLIALSFFLVLIFLFTPAEARRYRDCKDDAKGNLKLAFDYMKANMSVLKNDYEFNGRMPRTDERIRRRMDRELDDTNVHCHGPGEPRCRAGFGRSGGVMTHRIHICFRKFLSESNSFCALLEILAHEYAHSIGMPRQLIGHNTSDALDAPRMFGRFVRDLCVQDNMDRQLLPLPDPPAVPAPNNATQGITLFSQTSLRNRGRNFTSGSQDLMRFGPDLREIGRDDSTSSLQVLSSNWEVCERRDFLGWCLVVQAGQVINRLSDFSINNEISSLREITTPRTGLTLFKDRERQGLSRNFTDENRDLTQMNLNDQASSLAVHTGTWEVCRKKDFQDCVMVNANEDDLRTRGIDNRITSLRPR